MQKVMMEATQGVPLNGAEALEEGEGELMRGQGKEVMVGKKVVEEVVVGKVVVKQQ